MELVQLVFGIAKLGYRGPIGARALSSLVAWAKDYGVQQVLQWINDDPGLLMIPSWQFEILDKVRKLK